MGPQGEEKIGMPHQQDRRRAVDPFKSAPEDLEFRRRHSRPQPVLDGPQFAVGQDDAPSQEPQTDLGSIAEDRDDDGDNDH